MQGQRLLQSLLMVSILTPPVAWSYTMADMEVNSALNQKFNADIPIRLAPNEKPNEISVRMAAPSLFDQHKINRHPLLDKIQFKRIGTAIQITSNSPINVPTLEFILEINSRKGSSYQHYKISLNKNPAVNKAVSHTLEASKQSPVAINASPKPVAIPLATLAERLNKDNTFGPLQKSDSLAKIAKHIAKLRGIKTKVVQTALRANNPNAFYKGAHGGLIAGAFLVIPDFNAPKPVEAAVIATTPVPTVATVTPTPITTESPTATNVKVEPTNNAPAAIAPLANDLVVQQLLARLDKLEHHVEQIQIELNALQAQKAVIQPAPVEPQVTAQTTAETATPTPDEPTPETPPVTEEATKEPLFKLDDPGLLISLSLGLIAILAWITSRVVKARGTKKAVTPSPKKVTKEIKKAKVPKKTKEIEEPEEIETFDDLDTDLLTPQEPRSAASISTIPMDDSMNVDDLSEDDFEFDFLKNQANTAKAKKLKRPSSRYPADTPENLDS
jgi:Tfp pilus assembly protein FimV